MNHDQIKDYEEPKCETFLTLPDFIIRLKNGSFLVLETKGQDTQQDKTKRTFLDEWIKAVNSNGGFGKWSWTVSYSPGDIADNISSPTK